MKILRRISVPTGDILIVNGERGNLEMLSLGDYGKAVNLKCDVMGLSREISKVEHTAMLPLEEKWVITISTQYGCSMKCPYCDVPRVGPGTNATFCDLMNQIIIGLNIHPEIVSSRRLNVHFARMGEPTWNFNVLGAAEWLKKNIDPRYKCHPVVSTMMPRRNKQLKNFIHSWMKIKNEIYCGEAGLQISVNSTNESERDFLFNRNACSLEQIAEMMKNIVPNGRKITLNFAIAGYEIDPDVLLRHFDPVDYVIKLTPMHKTLAASLNGINTPGDYTTFYPYKQYEEALKEAGYDVMVFIASEYEDLGRITCGNAILSGTMPAVPYQVI